MEKLLTLKKLNPMIVGYMFNNFDKDMKELKDILKKMN